MIANFHQALAATRKHVADRIHLAMRHYAGLPDYSEHTLYEGDGAITIHEDGSKSAVEMRQMTASHEKVLEPFALVPPQEIYRMLDELGYQMAEQQRRQFVDVIGQAAEDAGNVLKHPGQLTPEHIFAMYRKVELGFFADGRPHELAMVSHPDMVAAYEKLLEEIKSTPALRAQFDGIIDEQRRAWHVRENLRKLVG